MSQSARPDAIAKLRGETLYTADISRPNSLHGYVIRSPHAAARIRGIDTSAAVAAAGVVCVLTAAEVPDVLLGLFVSDEPLLADDEVRYVGEPVALVAAESYADAQRAARKVLVDYEPLDPVLNLDQALDSNARPVIGARPNVTEESRVTRGDVDTAFAAAHAVISTTVTSQRVHQTYIEPRASLAEMDGDVLTVHTSTQAPFEVRSHLAKLFGLPLARVVVKTPAIGGGFGGKLHLGLAGYAAVLCRRTRRPVRVVATREEEHQSPAPRENSTITLESAVSSDGRLLARRARLYFDSGAYAYDTPPIAAVGAMQACGPYVAEALDIASYAYYTNSIPTGSFRAPSAPQMSYAVEKHMNDIAQELGVDAVRLRFTCAMRTGSVGPTGQPIHDDAFLDVLQRGATTLDKWVAEEVAVGPDERRGVGLGCAWWTVSPVGGAVSLSMNEDGSVQVHTGATEIGTGAVVSALRTVVADVLHLDEGVVSVISGGTDVGPVDHGSQGSRTLYGVGTATGRAATEMKRLLADEFARQREAPVDDVVLDGGRLTITGVPAVSASIAEIAGALVASSGPLVTSGRFQPAGPSFEAGCVSGWVDAFHEPTFHCQVADVVVNVRTGRVDVRRIRAIHDVGAVVNVAGAVGQVEGGVVQGVGYALFEELITDATGRTLNTNLHDYRVPTFADAPGQIQVDLVSGFSTSQAYRGMKGVGEAPIIPTAAAIGSAVRTALGDQPDQLPMTSERLAALADTSGVGAEL